MVHIRIEHSHKILYKKEKINLLYTEHIILYGDPSNTLLIYTNLSEVGIYLANKHTCVLIHYLFHNTGHKPQENFIRSRTSRKNR